MCLFRHASSFMILGSCFNRYVVCVRSLMLAGVALSSRLSR